MNHAALGPGQKSLPKTETKLLATTKDTGGSAIEIVASTPIALAAFAAILYLGPLRGLWVFFALLPFGAAAAFNLPALGGATIGLADLGAVALFSSVLLTRDALGRLVGTMRFGQPGFWILLLWLVCVISALFFPRLFAGHTDVFSISRVDGANSISLRPLKPGSGNISQAFRMSLGILTFLALATALRHRPQAERVILAVSTATVIHFILGWLDVLTFSLGLKELLEPIRTANYAMLVDHRMVGLKRMIGGFPEASSFGSFSLGLFGFWFVFWLRNPYTHRAGWMMLLTLVVLLRSTSSSAYLGLVLFMLLLGTLILFRSAWTSPSRRSVTVSAILAVITCLSLILLFGAYELSPDVAQFFNRALFEKAESSSGVERMMWNTYALKNFFDTWMIGAGVGSIRASNWLVACLGSIGLLGTLVYLLFLGSVARVRTSRPDPLTSAVVTGAKAACLALLVIAMLIKSTPDLEIFYFALAGLAVGLARGNQLGKSQDVSAVN